ncbi:MAG: energy transducer TonB [Azonexus sp.]
MTRADFRLAAALALSLLLHLLLLGPERIPPPRPPAPPLQAALRPPPPGPVQAAPPAPPLRLPEHAAPASPPAAMPHSPAGHPPRPAPPPKTWTQSVREQLGKQDSAGLFYPAEAIAQGLQGEVHVLLIIDEAGNVVATRLEQSSGHAILDEAALRAGRRLKSLPADAPRQTVLPIRFRLK